MARGFSIQDITCINFEGSLNGAPKPSSSSVAESIQRASTNGLLQEQQQQQQQEEQPQEIMPHPSDESVEACGGSGGIFSWLDRHREKRRREHLKLEAEKQLQKIGEAQRAAHRESLNSSAKSKSKRTAKAKNVNANISPTSSDKLDINRDQSLVDSISSSSSVASAAAAASSGGGSAASRSTEGRQQQYLTEPSHSFGHSDVSKSGEGASGMLSLSDIDGLCPDPNLSSSNSKPTLGDAPKAAANPSVPLEEDEDLVGPVRVTPTEGDDASPYILSQTQMNEISKHVLPETITYCRWRRLYGLGRDGDSFDGCLRIIGSEKRTLMVVRTTKGDIFGGYADAPWHSRHDSSTAKFYGSASSCLYSFSSTLQPYSTSSSPESSPLNVYRWTGKNRYIQVCDVSNKMLAFGGGGDKGAFGLCLQEDFTRGTTGHCDTFDNDPLCSGDERTFDICDLEFWEFQTGVF